MKSKNAIDSMPINLAGLYKILIYLMQGPSLVLYNKDIDNLALTNKRDRGKILKFLSTNGIFINYVADKSRNISLVFQMKSSYEISNNSIELGALQKIIRSTPDSLIKIIQNKADLNLIIDRHIISGVMLLLDCKLSIGNVRASVFSSEEKLAWLQKILGAMYGKLKTDKEWFSKNILGKDLNLNGAKNILINAIRNDTSSISKGVATNLLTYHFVKSGSEDDKEAIISNKRVISYLAENYPKILVILFSALAREGVKVEFLCGSEAEYLARDNKEIFDIMFSQLKESASKEQVSLLNSVLVEHYIKNYPQKFLEYFGRSKNDETKVKILCKDKTAESLEHYQLGTLADLTEDLDDRSRLAFLLSQVGAHLAEEEYFGGLETGQFQKIFSTLAVDSKAEFFIKISCWNFVNKDILPLISTNLFEVMMSDKEKVKYFAFLFKCLLSEPDSSMPIGPEHIFPYFNKIKKEENKATVLSGFDIRTFKDSSEDIKMVLDTIGQLTEENKLKVLSGLTGRSLALYSPDLLEEIFGQILNNQNKETFLFGVVGQFLKEFDTKRFNKLSSEVFLSGDGESEFIKNIVTYPQLIKDDKIINDLENIKISTINELARVRLPSLTEFIKTKTEKELGMAREGNSHLDHWLRDKATNLLRSTCAIISRKDNIILADVIDFAKVVRVQINSNNYNSGAELTNDGTLISDDKFCVIYNTIKNQILSSNNIKDKSVADIIRCLDKDFDSKVSIRE
jgi:hypothetical protein